MGGWLWRTVIHRSQSLWLVTCSMPPYLQSHFILPRDSDAPSSADEATMVGSVLDANNPCCSFGVGEIGKLKNMGHTDSARRSEPLRCAQTKPHRAILSKRLVKSLSVGRSCCKGDIFWTLLPPQYSSSHLCRPSKLGY